jgi:hypothetical protein
MRSFVTLTRRRPAGHVVLRRHASKEGERLAGRLVEFVAVPEPLTLPLVGIAAAFLVVRRRAAR